MKQNKMLVIASIPVLLVNTIAVTGQFLFIHDDWGWPIVFAVLAAIAVESIAVYLSYMHHAALIAEDAAYGLRLGSIGMGILAGLMNFSHYSPHWEPTSKGVVLGVLSASSPILWNVYSRRVSRDDLKAKGMIEPRAVKLGMLRWLLFPRESYAVFRRAVWRREVMPDAAISAWEAEQAAKRTAEESQRAAIVEAETSKRLAIESSAQIDAQLSAELAEAKTDADRVRIALRQEAHTPETEAPVIAQWLAAHGYGNISAGYVRNVRSGDRRKEAHTNRTQLRAINSGQ